MSGLHVMALGAHPDDIELSMAGLTLRFGAIGAQVTWVVATDGAAGHGGRDAALADLRAREAAEAAALAEAELVMLGHPDGLLAEQADAVGSIGAFLRGRPVDLLITHGPEDYHPDHRALSRLVTDVAPLGTSLLYAENLLGVGSTPNLLVDIGAVFDAKAAALACHRSQRPDATVEAIGVWNRFRGLQSGPLRYRHAEAYQAVPRLGSNALAALDQLKGYCLFP